MLRRMPKRKTAKKKTPESRAGDTRRPIERLFAIHDAVRRQRYPNCRRLAEEIGVTPKTIQRDITFMRENLELPLSYDPVKHGYHYDRPVTEFPTLRIAVEDVVALFLARRALQPLQGSPLEETLRHSFRQLSQSLRGEFTFQWSDLDEAFSVKDTGVVPADVHLFEKVSRAVLECRELRFDYRKLDDGDWQPRKLRPFHVAEFDGGWYVIGYDTDRNAKRTFALQRMKGVRILKSEFPRPTDFDLSDHLGGSFGVWHTPADEGARHRIRLRFHDWAARIVSERRWHPSQQIDWVGRKKETLEMNLELSSFEEITRWILSWGPQAEVMEPPELRDRIRESLAAAGERYESSR